MQGVDRRDDHSVRRDLVLIPAHRRLVLIGKKGAGAAIRGILDVHDLGQRGFVALHPKAMQIYLG